MKTSRRVLAIAVVVVVCCVATCLAVKDAKKRPELASSETVGPQSITSLHQIWTSASSDRLDELSPELISKMKADVPFLEAYALRPRLVGARDTLREQQASLAGQPSNRKANYLSPADFSELKVESASVSKTEHHHKRSTSLRKRSDESLANGGGPVDTIGARSNKAIRKQRRRRRARSNYRWARGLQHLEGTKSGEDAADQPKGGSPSGADRKKPFYASAKPTGSRNGDHLDEPESEPEVEAARGEEVEEDFRPAGDEDVEEGGDTVRVEPKSDGVDDDPELPDYEGGEPGEPGAGDSSASDKRVNRGQPEDSDEDKDVGDNTDEDSIDSSTGDGNAAGGGLGASTGSGTDDSSGRDIGVTPGVERADGDFLDDKPVAQKPKSLPEDGDSPAKEEPPTGKGENDLEYRDDDDDDDEDVEDVDEEDDDVHLQGGNRAHKEGDSDHSRDSDSKDGSDKEHSQRPADRGDRKQHEHTDQHHEDHEHKHSIECLEDAVPGEPGVDYPILERVNSSRFRCSDHKHPGYYADTETRCQVFHFCRPDGTQDSFLCPNGTIFSQKSSVCVWWNSFQCEDAPKYVGLNSLLYKQRPIDAGVGVGAAAPGAPDDTTNGGHQEGKTAAPKRPTGAFDEAAVQRKSSVPDADDDLADAEDRRRRAAAAAARLSSRPIGNRRWPWQASNNNNIAADDDDAAPRRKRRASSRQAPPKLKSSARRYMRPSRRVAYRIKNVSKPRRRS